MYNYFGATVADVASHFVTGCTSSSDVINQLGGSDIIEHNMELIVGEITASMCASTFSKILSVNHELIGGPTGLRNNTSSFQLGLKPVVDVIAVWSFASPPEYAPGFHNDLNTTEYTWSVDTNGVATVTRTNGLFSEGSFIYASYELDEAQLDFPSLKSIVCLGTAARIGPKIYSDENMWKYLETLEKAYNDKLKMIEECDYTLPELARLYWYQPPSVRQDIRSIPMWRA